MFNFCTLCQDLKWSPPTNPGYKSEKIVPDPVVLDIWTVGCRHLLWTVLYFVLYCVFIECCIVVLSLMSAVPLSWQFLKDLKFMLFEKNRMFGSVSSLWENCFRALLFINTAFVLQVIDESFQFSFEEVAEYCPPPLNIMLVLFWQYIWILLSFVTQAVRPFDGKIAGAPGPCFPRPSASPFPRAQTSFSTTDLWVWLWLWYADSHGLEYGPGLRMVGTAPHRPSSLPWFLKI